MQENRMSILSMMNMITFLLLAVFGFFISFTPPILAPIFFGWRAGLQTTKRPDGMAACLGLIAGTIPASYFIFWDVQMWKVNALRYSVHSVVGTIMLAVAGMISLGYLAQHRAYRKAHKEAAKREGTSGFTFRDDVPPNCGRCHRTMVGTPRNYKCLPCEGQLAHHLPPDVGM